MPATPTFATLCARLNRSPVYVRGLQRRFALPIPADSPSPPRSPRPRCEPVERLRVEASPGPTVPPSDRPTVQPTTSYTAPYFSFLETLLHLRVLGIPEDTLLHLWTIERKLMQLLHADSTGSPTWFLDACGSTANPDHRLLLSNFDIGAYLPTQSSLRDLRALRGGSSPTTLQLGLNFADKKPNPELFTAPEMGEDAILVLRQYQSRHQEILTAIHSETPVLRAALTHFPPPRRSPARHKTRPEPKTHIGTLIPGEI